jgi:hypothetical protein
MYSNDRIRHLQTTLDEATSKIQIIETNFLSIEKDYQRELDQTDVIRKDLEESLGKLRTKIRDQQNKAGY